MQAIVTNYFGPTDTQGSKIIARCDAGRVTVTVDGCSIRDAHKEAVAALCARVGWDGAWRIGSLPGRQGADCVAVWTGAGPLTVTD